MSLDTLAAQMAAGDVKDLNIIIKADVQGSVEAVQQSLEKLSNEEVKINVIHGAVGAINESDIVLADVSNAIIIGFNVRPSQMIIDKAKETGVDIRLYSVIYNAIEDVENAMKGMLAPSSHPRSKKSSGVMPKSDSSSRSAVSVLSEAAMLLTVRSSEHPTSESSETTLSYTQASLVLCSTRRIPLRKFCQDTSAVLQSRSITTLRSATLSKLSATSK